MMIKLAMDKIQRLLGKAKYRMVYRIAIVILMVSIFFLPLLSNAQSISIDLGQGGSITGRVVQLVVFLTVITLAPSLLIMVTSFTRIIVVLSILRTAIGTQQTPPNSVMVSLALFMSFFVMQPTLQKAYDDGIQPLIAERISQQQAYKLASAPIRNFMLAQVRENDLRLFFDIGKIENVDSAEQTPMRVLIPAFMISELRRAFEIGFLLFIPFLIIDMVIASILLSMGMLMIPPIIISLPFKLIFFVLVDGWNLVVGSLVQSFGTF